MGDTLIFLFLGGVPRSAGHELASQADLPTTSAPIDWFSVVKPWRLTTLLARLPWEQKRSCLGYGGNVGTVTVAQTQSQVPWEWKRQWRLGHDGNLGMLPRSPWEHGNEYDASAIGGICVEAVTMPTSPCECWNGTQTGRITCMCHLRRCHLCHYEMLCKRRQT